MHLPEKLAAFHRNFEAGGPPFNAAPEIHEPMHRATADLIASGAADRALQAGERIPSFALKDSEGAIVTSAELLASGPLVITFYRGIWCPYCNMDLQALEEIVPQVSAVGARLVAISPQTPPNSRRSRRENTLSFPILSDPGNMVANAFGLRFRMPDAIRDIHRDHFKVDLAVLNGDASWTLPMPARYVVGPDGLIHYAEVNPDYTKRPDPSEVLPALGVAVDREAD